MNNSEICLSRFSFVQFINGDIAFSDISWSHPPCAEPFFGIAAPLFLWVGCFVILCITGFFCSKICWQSWGITRPLKRLIKQIDAIEPKDSTLDGVGLEKLRQVMASTTLVKDAWREFDETLLVNHDGVFNTGQADEYFSEDAIIGGRINLRFYADLPGILTSVGLLLTFIAILLGLSAIDFASSDSMKKGVESLVANLSGKFISSICALGCAVLFTFLEKFIEGRISYRVHEFIRTLNRRFARKPTDHILQLIQKDISEQSIAFRQFGTDLSGSLKESFSEGMGPHLQKIAEAVEELKKQKSESLVDSLGQVLSEFKSALMGSTNSEFKVLETTLSRTADLMSSMNEQSKQSQEKMSELIQSFEVAISKQSSTGQDHLSRLANTMEIVIDKLQSAGAQSSVALTSSVATSLEQMQASFSSQAAEMSRRNDELGGLMRAMLHQIQSTLSESSSSVTTTVTGLLEQSSQWTGETAAQLSEVLQEQSKNARAITDARSSLNDALEIFKRAVTDGSTTLTNLGSASSVVLDGVTLLNTATINLRKTQDGVSDVASLVQKNAENLKIHVEKQATFVSSYEHVFKDLDKALGSTLNQVTSSIENYSAKVKASLEATLSQFDNHLGNATAKLGGTVEELSESLEELVELASKSRHKDL